MKTNRRNNLKAIKGKGSYQVDVTPHVELTMLPLAKCREILNNDELLYTDEEIIIIRDYLYRLAAIVAEQVETENEQKQEQAKIISLTEHKNNEYAKSNHLRTG
jgi:hypothetical protein